MMLLGRLSLSSNASSLLRSLQLEAILAAEDPAWILIAALIRIWESPSTSNG